MHHVASPPLHNAESLIANCSIGIAHAGAGNRVDYCNAAFERMFHCRANDAAGTELGSFVGFTEPDAKQALHRAARGEPVQLTARAGRNDDDPIVVEFHAVPDLSPDAGGFWGLFQDITDRRRIEHLLRVARELFFKTFQLSPLAKVLSTARENRLIEVNNAWTRLTGYTRKEAIGRTPAELELFDDPMDFGRLNAAIEAGDGRLRDVECRFRARDGRLTVGSLSAEDFDVEGTTMRMVVVADITALRDAEAMVSKVTQSMIEAQEWERLRIARELHDDVGQRLAVWQLEMDRAVDSLNGAPAAAAVHKMRELQRECRTIAADLQALSRELHSPALSLLSIDKSLKRLCMDVSTRSGVDVEFRSSHVPRSVPAEVSLCLFRVLQEALNNAVKHSGTPRVVVRLTGTAGAIELRARDFGTGVADERAHTARGLGLITMRERVALVNGRFCLLSPSDGGTEIDIRIPL